MLVGDDVRWICDACFNVEPRQEEKTPGCFWEGRKCDLCGAPFTKHPHYRSGPMPPTQIHVEPADHDTDLCAMLGKYGSDKGNATGTARHNYSRYYVALFRPIREQVRRVFELGIFQGASLRAWRDYFPHAQVYGADIDPGLIFTEERIGTVPCDETDEGEVARLWRFIGGDIDILIDDALHTYVDNRRFFNWSHGQVKPGGLYIIEDLRADELDLFRAWAIDLRKEGWAAHVVVLPRVVNGEDIPDNNLLVMRKPAMNWDALQASLPTADPNGLVYVSCEMTIKSNSRVVRYMSPERPSQDWAKYDGDDVVEEGRYTDEEHAEHIAKWETACAEWKRTGGLFVTAGPMLAEAVCRTDEGTVDTYLHAGSWRCISHEFKGTP